MSFSVSLTSAPGIKQMPKDPTSWAERLALQQTKGLFRQPKPKPKGFADFCSNDFLGLGQQSLVLPTGISAGATGSRHVSGLHTGLEELEQWAATFWGAERAVFFPTGFQANLGVIQALATRHDVILMDERIHASLRDAARGTLAQTHFFAHNSVTDLEAWLERAQAKRTAEGEIYVVTEGVFSMAGTHAPLAEMVTLCDRFQAILIVDEAHSVGLYGKHGRGCVDATGLSARVPIRIFPLGKAAGVQGGLIVGSFALGQMLENFSRPLIYSTAPSPVLTWAVLDRLKAMADAEEERVNLKQVEERLDTLLVNRPVGAVVPVFTDDEKAWPAILETAVHAKLWVKPIRYPTVPKGEECLRLTLHSNQTDDELHRLGEWIRAFDLQPLRVQVG